MAGVILLLIGLYAVAYINGQAAVNRYADGFVLDTCPVCKRGELVLESRQKRVLGIPTPARTVRCTECRSVLREVGTRRWRYAVDRIEDPDLFERFNGRAITEAVLVRLGRASKQRTDSPDSSE